MLRGVNETVVQNGRLLNSLSSWARILLLEFARKTWDGAGVAATYPVDRVSRGVVGVDDLVVRAAPGVGDG